MLLRLYNKNNNPKDLEEVIRVLEEGGLIIYPTDTMYAIGCHGLKERAIERICKLKNIDPRKKQFIHYLLRLKQYQRICQSRQQHIQANETQSSRTVHFYPEYGKPSAQNIQEP